MKFFAYRPIKMQTKTARMLHLRIAAKIIAGCIGPGKKPAKVPKAIDYKSSTNKQKAQRIVGQAEKTVGQAEMYKALVTCVGQFVWSDYVVPAYTVTTSTAPPLWQQHIADLHRAGVVIQWYV